MELAPWLPEVEISGERMVSTALQVLDAVTRSRALEGLLGTEPDVVMADREAAALSLVVHFSQVKRDANLFRDRACRALGALTALVCASHSLHGYPLAKRAFWRRALEHPTCRSLLVNARELAHAHALRYEDPQFPRLVLDASRTAFAADLLQAVADWQWTGDAGSDWLGGIRVEVPGTRSRRVNPVTVRLQRCKLTAIDVKHLEVVLTPCAPASEGGDASRNWPKPRFRVAVLDLTDNPLDEARMNALAAVIRSASQPLDALVLENVMPRMGAPRVMTAFRALIRTAAGLTPGCRGGVRSLSLACNSLTTEHFASVCSAAQHPSSSIEELCLARTISIHSPDDRFYCWWWLAIGLSRRVDRHVIDDDPSSRLRRVDLSHNPLFPRDVDVWNSTMQSPMAVLSSGSVQPSPMSVYRVSAHGVRVFSAPCVDAESAKPIPEATGMFSALPSGLTVAFEALGVNDDGWVCVLLPGYGLVWAPPAPGQESTAGDVSEQRQPVVTELEVDEMGSVDTTVDSLCALLQSVGGSLESLSVKHTVGSTEQHLETILAHCPRLERLDLQGTRFPSWEPLIRAIEGPLGLTLRSLTLRSNRFGQVAAGQLASALEGTTARLPALEEIRLGQTPIGFLGAASMERLLYLNKRLRVLELPRPSLDEEEYAVICDSIARWHQGELLEETPVPMICKLAFLSVLHARQDMAALDTGVLRFVFELAAGESRRSIVWWRRS